MVLKKILFTLFALLTSIIVLAKGPSLDSKYLKIGYVSNVDLGNSGNSYIRNIGNIPNLEFATETQLNEHGVGKKVLDLILMRTQGSLDISHLYNLALSNVALSEDERASLDASADKRDVLKKTIARQLLQNNYIILSAPFDGPATLAGYNKQWRIFHVDIDDQIINQVFLNWDNMLDYDLIKVPVSMIAQGLAKTNAGVIEAIINKTNIVAPHSSILNRHPFTIGIGIPQGARLLDRVDVYRLYENKNGSIKEKKICTTRITEVTYDTSRLFSINGGYASQNKGDIAVLRKNRRLNNISIVAQGSFGKDYRYGGRIFYERLLKLSKHGVSQYILGSVEYNRYCREPEGIWYPFINAEECVRPTLSNFGVNLGYSFGFMGLLGKIEIVPYAMAGFKVHLFDRNVHHYDWTGSVGDEPQPTFGLDVCGGVKANINIWYPLQLTLGADYNFNLSSIGEQDVTTIYLEHHRINRLNVYAGFRFNF